MDDKQFAVLRELRVNLASQLKDAEQGEKNTSQMLRAAYRDARAAKTLVVVLATTIEQTEESYKIEMLRREAEGLFPEKESSDE